MLIRADGLVLINISLQGFAENKNFMTEAYCEKCKKVVTTEVISCGEHYMETCVECDNLISEE